MKIFLCLLTLAGCTLAQLNQLTPVEKAEGWILLFDGSSLKGWVENGQAKWRVQDGAILAEEGGNGWLRSEGSFSDFVLKCEFRTHEKGNSGIFLRAAKDGQPHVTGYELQIWNYNEEFPTGSFVNHVASKGGRLKGDEWNSYQVTARGDQWVVKLNGETVLETRDGKASQGHIGLQSNKDRIEFRSMKLKPLGLR